MASWITHLMIADRIMPVVPWLDRRGFCVGNIAPDCNIENEDWTAFTPSREVTHWIQGKRKSLSDCEYFLENYVLPRREQLSGNEEFSFLIGYYTHLVADAVYDPMLKDPGRLHAMWGRMMESDKYGDMARELAESFQNSKLIMSKEERLADISLIEAEYLYHHPESGYLTEILPLREFPDYLDYLPHGAIVRKTGNMALPAYVPGSPDPIAVSRGELYAFIDDTVERVTTRISELGQGGLIPAYCMNRI